MNSREVHHASGKTLLNLFCQIPISSKPASASTVFEQQRAPAHTDQD